MGEAVHFILLLNGLVRTEVEDTHSPWLCVERMTTIRIMADSEILVKFGERVRELRKKQGFSQEGFAHECKMDRTYLGGIERGERNLALINIERIAKALDMTLSQLMKGL